MICNPHVSSCLHPLEARHERAVVLPVDLQLLFPGLATSRSLDHRVLEYTKDETIVGDIARRASTIVTAVLPPDITILVRKSGTYRKNAPSRQGSPYANARVPSVTLVACPRSSVLRVYASLKHGRRWRPWRLPVHVVRV